MSTKWMTSFPLEILFVIIGSVDNSADLLAFALTCQFIHDMIIPDYLLYFRIASRMGDIELWEHLSQNLHLCRNVREFKLTASAHRSPLVQIYDPFKSSPTPTTSSDLPIILRHMLNLRRVKIGEWSYTNFEVIRDILNALINSKCRLEEFDLFLTFPSGSTQMPETEMESENLQLWSKINLISLQKLSLSIEKSTNDILIWRGQPSLFREFDFTVNMLSNASALTKLNLTVRYTSRVNLFDFTCPNLENLTISIIGHLSMNTSQDPSILIDFFKRHPKLTTLSLPSNVYVPTSSPYITLESLPRLESLAYYQPVQVPLSHILSPASARRLRHLTITDGDASLENSDMGIYRELASLRTCRFASGTYTSTNYENINKMLKNFVAHATNVQKIHLPMYGSQCRQHSLYLETLSILQHLPNLTHLSGIALRVGNPPYDVLLQELYHFCRLKYVITPLPQLCAFQLTRDLGTKRMSVDDQPLAGRNLDCDITTWGNFYRGMES